MKHLIDKVNISVRKMKLGNEGNLNAGYFKNEKNISRLIHKDKANKFMASLTGSPPYFEKVSKELMASIRQLGPTTFFMTLSAAETRWSHLLKMLSLTVDKKELSKDEIKELNWKEKCRLIAKDPITCARNFDL